MGRQHWATGWDSNGMMTVEEAITGRRSTRAFLDTPVPRGKLEHILRVAARAPSGSNIQPWHVYVVEGAVKDRLSAAILRRAEAGDEGAWPYNYYPVKWREPYLARRRACGFGLYNTLGIARGDTAAMKAQRDLNFTFFGAPLGLMFTIDRDMETGSWLDYGMFLQSIMIAARAEGFETCAQAAFAPYAETVHTELRIPRDQMVVCGMAVGYAAAEAPVNGFVTERMALNDFVTWVDA
jgi:nitroreductase